MTRTLMGYLTGLMLCFAGMGCQSLSSTSFTSIFEDKAPTGKPTEVGAIWQDGIDVQLDAQHGGLPVRGFAGRVFFMQARQGQASQTVLIDGTLQVLLYDDRPVQGQGPPIPLETWTILPEHLSMLVKKDMTGWGYSLWLPWNTYHPSIQSVRMSVQYTGRDGTKLIGEPIMIQINDSHRGGLPKPKLDVQQIPKKTWQ